MPIASFAIWEDGEVALVRQPYDIPPFKGQVEAAEALFRLMSGSAPF